MQFQRMTPYFLVDTEAEAAVAVALLNSPIKKLPSDDGQLRKAPSSPFYGAQGERKSENPLILSEAEYKDSFDTDC
jgi:hypothetical protein